jgi:hypothetical protein
MCLLVVSLGVASVLWATWALVLPRPAGPLLAR